jgi:hypothetical protein
MPATMIRGRIVPEFESLCRMMHVSESLRLLVTTSHIGEDKLDKFLLENTETPWTFEGRPMLHSLDAFRAELFSSEYLKWYAAQTASVLTPIHTWLYEVFTAWEQTLVRCAKATAELHFPKVSYTHRVMCHDNVIRITNKKSHVVTVLRMLHTKSPSMIWSRYGAGTQAPHVDIKEGGCVQCFAALTSGSDCILLSSASASNDEARTHWDLAASQRITLPQLSLDRQAACAALKPVTTDSSYRFSEVLMMKASVLHAGPGFKQHSGKQFRAVLFGVVGGSLLRGAYDGNTQHLPWTVPFDLNVSDSVMHKILVDWKTHNPLKQWNANPDIKEKLDALMHNPHVSDAVAGDVVGDGGDGGDDGGGGDRDDDDHGDSNDGHAGHGDCHGDDGGGCDDSEGGGDFGRGGDGDNDEDHSDSDDGHDGGDGGDGSGGGNYEHDRQDLCRRSKRKRTQPLAFWMNERPVYDRRWW